MGHGHVIPNPDGSKVRCGGPMLCSVCKLELGQKKNNALLAATKSGVPLPSIGRIVHYRLSIDDARNIEINRTLTDIDGRSIFTGTPVTAGEVVPLIIVRVELDDLGEGKHAVSGQAFLNGDDTFWVCRAAEGTGPGRWQWPPRV